MIVGMVLFYNDRNFEKSMKQQSTKTDTGKFSKLKKYVRVPLEVISEYCKFSYTVLTRRFWVVVFFSSVKV